MITSLLILRNKCNKNRETNESFKSSRLLINNENAISLMIILRTRANRGKQAQIMPKLAQKQVVVGNHSS